MADLYQNAELVGDTVRAVYQHVGGKVRHTYSTVERLQVKLSAADPERYLVACNQRRTHLHAVSKKGSAVAGVRFKAWKPSEAPHPSLPLQTQLVFDLFDRFTETIIDGSRYHVAHPGVEIIKNSLSMNTKHKHVDWLDLKPTVRPLLHILFRRKFNILNFSLL